MKKDTFLQINKNVNDWWLSTKSKIIISLIKQRFKKTASILDVASGTGYLAKKVKAAGYKKITVSDRSKAAIEILKSKFKVVKKINLPKKISTYKKFDCILVLDVLEHIDDDLEALKQIKKLLKPEGVMILTVPAFQFLWSKKDDRVEHKRRYNKKSFKALINKSNLKIEYLSYYNFFLFFPAWVYSILNKDKEKVPRYNNLQNTIFSKIFAWEIPLIKKRVSFPFGVSLITIVTNEKK